MIDWLNPSDDVLAARRVGYEEGVRYADERMDALEADLAAAQNTKRHGPRIVCLCGSTRFMDAFFEVGWQKTLAGEIVLSVGVCKHSEADADGGHAAEQLELDAVRRLDKLHLRKIDLADYVMVLNVGGYIGKGCMRGVEFRGPVTCLERKES